MKIYFIEDIWFYTCKVKYARGKCCSRLSVTLACNVSQSVLDIITLHEHTLQVVQSYGVPSVLERTLSVLLNVIIYYETTPQCFLSTKNTNLLALCPRNIEESTFFRAQQTCSFMSCAELTVVRFISKRSFDCCVVTSTGKINQRSGDIILRCHLICQTIV